ncbi:MAG: Lcl C-terminal domain-containing protein [Methylomonas sp.]
MSAGTVTNHFTIAILVAVLSIALMVTSCSKSQESSAYQAACQGDPLDTVELRAKAMEDGYDINRQFNCIDKVSFLTVNNQREKWKAANTHEAIAQREAEFAKQQMQDAEERVREDSSEESPAVQAMPNITLQNADSNTATKGDIANGISMQAREGDCRYFDGFEDGQNGTVTDPRNGLVWQRCAAGQSWSGSSCKGEGLEMSWWDAMQSAKDNRFLSKADWRLPTTEELKAIVGKHEDCLISDETKKPWRAVSPVFPAVRDDGYVGSFWSSTTFTSSGAWVVYFFDGGVFSVGRNAHVVNVRLVRGGKESGWDEFDREYANMPSSRYWPVNARK